jgi:feruloyl esterase
MLIKVSDANNLATDRVDFQIMLARTLIALATLPIAFGAAACDELKKLELKNTTITFASPQSGGVCRVAATIKPTSDSDIKIEVWLPEKWNGKLEGNGNGGWTGSISDRALATGVQRGYAAAMTNTGHDGGSASFAYHHPEKLVDFGYRSTHEMTVAAKAIINAYYGKPPTLSYFTGCSAGGRQALMEAQRFPEDYDGIVAGSPGANWSGRALLALWIAQAVHKDDASFIPASLFPAIHDAALAACDAQDGLKDGVIENPSRCKFDPKVLECKNGASTNCLAAAQVESARKTYGPVTNSRTGAAIVPGFSPGSEQGWATMGGHVPLMLGIELFHFVVFSSVDWDYKTFDWDADVERTLKASESLNALNPDLTKFAARGGKLIQYHGWSDPQIAPETSVAYFKSVVDKSNPKDIAEFYRLFMVPGMAHCGGGDGASSFDMLTAIEQWREQKHAPESIPAARIRDGKTDRTRPLCPFPQVAKYKGSGNPDDAESFSCMGSKDGGF